MGGLEGAGGFLAEVSIPAMPPTAAAAIVDSAEIAAAGGFFCTPSTTIAITAKAAATPSAQTPINCGR